MEEKFKQFHDQIEQGKSVIDRLNKKDFAFYFFTLDTKGNPTAGVANIYEHVKTLNELGFKAAILHEKNDYKLKGDEKGHGIADWLGEEYANLPHVSIEAQQLNVSAADAIIVPEIFANIMDQLKGFPCKRIVLSQSYDYLLDLLPIGKKWNTDFGIYDVITTSERQANYLTSLFHTIRTHVVPVSIPSYFKPSDKPKTPVVSIFTRNQGDASKIAKAFYLKYPIYKWITFKELRGLPRETFAKELGKSCLAVWIDDQAGFGTFPVEAMECETPVIGKIPNMIPEWMETTDEEGNPIINNNGIWTNTTLNIPELIATHLKLWLEDSTPSDMMNSIKESQGKYTPELQRQAISDVYTNLTEIRVSEIQAIVSKLEAQLEEAKATPITTEQ